MVGAPVYIGIARRDRQDAVRSAERAAAEAARAAAYEARAATLTERSRITLEIHDVLGHALSQIALQLGLADTLHGKGRDEEANLAVHRARALAVEGMTETRRAIHSLRVHYWAARSTPGPAPTTPSTVDGRYDWRFHDDHPADRGR